MRTLLTLLILGAVAAAEVEILGHELTVTIDPEKAALILNRKEHPRIEVERSGAVLGVPVSYKLGPIRQTTLDPNPDRIYFTFFANPGHHVQRGDTVTLLLGDFRAENIVVQ